MKVRVRIDGYVDVDDAATEEQIREAVMFQLGWGGMAVDNPVGEPDWDDIDVDVEFCGLSESGLPAQGGIQRHTTAAHDEGVHTADELNEKYRR